MKLAIWSSILDLLEDVLWQHEGRKPPCQKCTTYDWMNLWVMIVDNLHMSSKNEYVVNLELTTPILEKVTHPTFAWWDAHHEKCVSFSIYKEPKIQTLKICCRDQYNMELFPMSCLGYILNVFFHTMQSLRTPTGLGATFKNSLS